MFDNNFDDPEPRPPASTGRGGLIALAALVGALVGALAGGGAGYFTGTRSTDTTAAVPPAPTATTPAVVNQVRVEQTSAFTEAIQRVLPAMVVLEVEGPERRDAQGRLVQATSVGSGVIVDPRGYVVTNAHVVESAQLITVTLNDGRQLPGVVLDEDEPYTDLAVVKIQEGGLTAAELGDSSAIQLGDLVASIGTPVISTELPRAFQDSVTIGVVSGVDRSWIREGVVQEGLIQTDSALNHGNSGGALINLQGQVIGITTTVVREAETGQTVEGIGFAIASNTVREVAEPIIATGSVGRPLFGVTSVPVTEALAATNNLPVQEGAFVREVLPDTPAADAGIRAGDIIVRLGETPITIDQPLTNVLKSHRPGERVTVVLNRGGQEVPVDVLLAEG